MESAICTLTRWQKPAQCYYAWWTEVCVSRGFCANWHPALSYARQVCRTMILNSWWYSMMINDIPQSMIVVQSPLHMHIFVIIATVEGWLIVLGHFNFKGQNKMIPTKFSTFLWMANYSLCPLKFYVCLQLLKPLFSKRNTVVSCYREI